MRIFNKQGIVFRRLMHYAYRILYALFVLLSVIFLIKMVVYTSVPTAELEMEGLANRLYNDPAILYQDAATGRSYSGIVDASKLTSENVEASLQTSKKKIAAELTLVELDTGKTVVAYYHKDLFDQMVPFVLVNTPLKGASSGTYVIKQYPVLYTENQETKNGILLMTIIRQND